MVNYVEEVTAKKSCKCDEYGSFEHLLVFQSVHEKHFVNREAFI